MSGLGKRAAHSNVSLPIFINVYKETDSGHNLNEVEHNDIIHLLEDAAQVNDV